MPDEISIEWRETTPWKFYNYALLHSGGIDNVFNLMRYDNAFFVRPKDVETIRDAANDKLDFVRSRFTILLCKADEKGITRPGWSHKMTMSHQEYEEIREHTKMFDLVPIGIPIDFHTGGLKWRGTAEIEADLAQVLKVMFNNAAFPDDEATADAIEQAFHTPTTKFKVKLARFCKHKEAWHIPPSK